MLPLVGFILQGKSSKGSTALGVWNETRVRTHEDLLLYTYSDYSLKMDLSAAIKAKRILLPSDAD